MSTPKLVHHLYYVTQQEEPQAAMTEFVEFLLEKGFTQEFLHSGQITYELWPVSVITKRIAVGAAYME